MSPKIYNPEIDNQAKKSLTDLAQAETWVFDLDNTLYPAECDLFAQIDARMTQFVGQYLGLPAQEARALQKHYYATYGTTLNGMMTEHGMKPEEFLGYVHDLDYSPVVPAPELAKAIEGLGGKKIVFTNGSRGHAQRTLAALGLDGGIFDEVFGIEDAKYTPKPRREAFDILIETHDFDPKRAVMVEDLSRNLMTAHDLGFATLLVYSWKDWSHEPQSARPAGPESEAEAHVDFITDDLESFLHSVVEARSSNGAITGNRA